MRLRTGIPTGDLFAVLSSWKDEARVAAAFATILELEAEAAASLELAPGLEELLEQCVEDGLRLALVTRNTPAAADALFGLLGEAWRARFSPLLTRHFEFVKPDRRLLLHVASAWGCRPSQLLMVGDSSEDVEVGASVGAATVLISGGGNETSAPVGVSPTLTVSSLSELGAALRGPAITPPCSLPFGVAFVEFLFTDGHVAGASCSYPNLGSAAGGMAVCTAPGAVALHLDCGDGALTKALASHGVVTVALDSREENIASTTGRGLDARLCSSSAPAELFTLPAASFDLVLCCAPARLRADSLLTTPTSFLLSLSGVAACRRLLKPGGRLAVEWARGDAGLSPSGAAAQLAQPGGGFKAVWCKSTASGARAARLVALRTDEP